MAYTPTNWVDGTTPVNATNLNKLEAGLQAAAAGADTANTGLAGKQDTSAKGAANGYAGLDSGSQVPLAQLPIPTVVNGQWLKGSGGAMVWAAITEADVAGLTADLAAKEAIANKGVPSGYASLDASGKVPAAQLPASAPATQTRQYPLKLLAPRSSSLAGNAFWTVATTTLLDFAHWEFVKDVEGRVTGQILIPKTVSATPNAKIVLIITSQATTGVTRMNVLYLAQGTAGGWLGGTLTSAGAQDLTIGPSSTEFKRMTFNLGAVSADQLLLFEIVHEGAHANDTLAQNTWLVEAYLEIDS